MHLKSVPQIALKEIIKDIFGVQHGEVWSMGLVDAQSSEIFDLELERLKERWDTLAPGFQAWFTNKQLDTFVIT